MNNNNIQSVVNRLRKITHRQVKSLLDAKHKIDLSVGIIIVKLEHIESIASASGRLYEFYAARVLPPTEESSNYVNPHYHLRGEEPYRFLSGEGEMNVGFVRNDEVIWEKPKAVSPNDEIKIQEGEVHSFRNIGKNPADFLFACPAHHLINYTETTPEGDRYFTKGLKNGIPSWYSSKNSASRKTVVKRRTKCLKR